MTNEKNAENNFDRTLYLVRHGEIQKPVAGKTYIGQLDLQLSARGCKQAEALAEQLKEIRLSGIYASDLKRCMDTAGYIAAKHNLLPIPVPALREIALGQWEGLSFETVQKKYPKAFARRGCDFINFRPPQGESFMDLSQRVIPSLYQVLSTTNGNILIVAHAGVNRIILCQAMGVNLKDLFSIPQKYAGLYIIKFSIQPFSLHLP